MLSSTGCEAIAKKVCLELVYDGFSRIVEVHCVGVNTKDNPAMRVWQVRGGSQSNEPVGWKMLLLGEAKGAKLTTEPSKAPRDGYKRGDKGMKTIECEV